MWRRVRPSSIAELAPSGRDWSRSPERRRWRSRTPPVNGPQDLGTALADFGNQLIRKAWINSPEGLSARKPIDSVLESARRSFGYLDFRDPRLLALPFELPFSAGGILAEGLLRLMAVCGSSWRIWRSIGRYWRIRRAA